ncbi:MAG: ATP-binding cassette domain-containing protein [Pseudonocardiaceae bacterium]
MSAAAVAVLGYVALVMGVLNDIDTVLEISGGATMALVGRSGAGKSVLAGLLGGLYRPERGLVTIDERPVDGLTDVGLRSPVAYTFERPALLGATLGEATGYGRGEPDDVAVLAAARAAATGGL